MKKWAWNMSCNNGGESLKMKKWTWNTSCNKGSNENLDEEMNMKEWLQDVMVGELQHWNKTKLIWIKIVRDNC